MNPTPEAVSLAQFARMRGVSRKTTSTWKQRGWLVMTEGGLVDVAASTALLSQRPETYRGGRTKRASVDAMAAAKALEELHREGALLSTAEALRMKENFQARLKKLEYEQASRQLLPLDQVELGYRTLANTFRANVLALPSAATGECAAARDAPQIFAVLTKHCRGLLQRIANTEYGVEEGDDGAATA
jgi:hypothetical protein